jgi:hypothetical protein
MLAPVPPGSVNRGRGGQVRAKRFGDGDRRGYGGKVGRVRDHFKARAINSRRNFSAVLGRSSRIIGTGDH